MNTTIDSSDIHWKVIEDIDKLNDYVVEWQHLCLENKDSFFTSPLWIKSWINVYWQKTWQLKVILGYEDSKLTIFMPFYLKTSAYYFSKSTLFPLGQGEPEESEVTSEYQDILIAKQSSISFPDIALKLKELDVTDICWNAILPNANILKIAPYYRKITPKLTGARYCIEDIREPKDFLSKNNRSKWNKCLNKLIALNAKIIWVPPQDYQLYWGKMKELHQQRWHKKQKLGAFVHNDFTTFHQKCSTPDNVKISAIKIDNIPIAINYYYCHDNVMYFYQCGWDEENHANISPGFSLHVWSILNNPMKKYDFMMGSLNDSYKSKFVCNTVNKMYNVKTESAIRRMYGWVVEIISSFRNL